MEDVPLRSVVLLSLAVALTAHGAIGIIAGVPEGLLAYGATLVLLFAAITLVGVIAYRVGHATARAHRA